MEPDINKISPDREKICEQSKSEKNPRLLHTLGEQKDFSDFDCISKVPDL